MLSLPLQAPLPRVEAEHGFDQFMSLKLLKGFRPLFDSEFAIENKARLGVVALDQRLQQFLRLANGGNATSHCLILDPPGTDWKR